jgi:hypothetical protein
MHYELTKIRKVVLKLLLRSKSPDRRTMEFCIDPEDAQNPVGDSRYEAALARTQTQRSRRLGAEPHSPQ